MTNITPRTNTELFGHEQAEALLMQDFAKGTLAHGWIISGPRGIGKATLAYRFARMLLSCHLEQSAKRDSERSLFAESDPSTPLRFAQDDKVMRRIAAGSHSDLLVVEQRYDTKKEELVRDISVDQAREIGKFLSLTPGEGQWRVVIIDAADALNTNAANAILKILEEPPPQAILMLISHNPSRLLPTIRSRCRMLRLQPLSQHDFTATMQHIAPDVPVDERTALAMLANNAPGVAMELKEQGAIELYEQILELVSVLPKLDTGKIHAFADHIGTGTVHANWQLLTRLMLCLLERITKQATGIGSVPLSKIEEETLQRLAEMHPPSIWAAKWQQCADQFSLAERLHLDYKQVIITFMHSLADKEIFHLGNIAA